MVEAEKNSDGPVTRILLKVVPGSRRDQVVGKLGDRLKVKVAAAPEDGKANKAVCELLAESLGIGVRAVTIVVGQTNPEKTARVEGLSCEEVQRRLGI
jgi:uncharacterized protein (TIGR00251 family)